MRTLLPLLLLLTLNSCAPWGWGPPPWDKFAKDELGVDFYISTWRDLNEDGVDEIILYAKNQCGSHGCNLYILAEQEDSFRVISRIAMARLPIRLLETSNRGWRDIAVSVQGRGLSEAYEVRLPFDGEGYATDPTVPPAARIGVPAGEIMIDN